MKKLKSYLIELTIVTIGVLIALLLNNFKERYEANEFNKASLKTIKNEVVANYSALKEVIDKHTGLLEQAKKDSNANVPIGNLISKAGGVTLPTLNNTGLEFYTRNQIASIDFDIMSTLISMNKLSDLIDTKLEKLADYVYSDIFAHSKESRMIFIMYLRNVLESENQLLTVYQNYIDDHNNNEK